MKNKIYILGLLSCLLVIAGSIMKIGHIAGAGIILTAGIFTLCILFLPAAVISSYRSSGKNKPWLYLSVFITVFISFTGALFKIMHWPGAGIMIVAGLITPIIIFLPVYLYYHFKDQEESQANFLYIMFLLVYLSGMSAMLSVNVSKNIIDDTIRIERISNLSNYFRLTQRIPGDNDQIAELKTRSAELLNYIESVKVQLVLYGNEVNQEAINKAGEIDVMKLSKKDNRDIPRVIMFGNKEATTIKKKLEDYHQYLIDLSVKNNLTTQFKTLELVTVNEPADQQEPSWEVSTFGDLPLIFVLQKLTEIENNIIISTSAITSEIGLKSAV